MAVRENFKTYESGVSADILPQGRNESPEGPSPFSHSRIPKQARGILRARNETSADCGCRRLGLRRDGDEAHRSVPENVGNVPVQRPRRHHAAGQQ